MDKSIVDAQGVSNVMAGYGQITTGPWLATVIGALLVLSLLAWSALASLRILRRRRNTAGELPAAAMSAAPQRDVLATDTATSPPAATPPRAGPSTRRSTGKDRSALLIAEALVVRERLAGHIDATTYQSRMHDLASGSRA
jgi:hypothetical protein